MDCIKLKSFYASKEITARIKRQPTEWEKIFASYFLDKVLMSRICKQIQKLNPKRTKKPFHKWINELNRQFSKEEVEMANK
jgi:hypothetical protein